MRLLYLFGPSSRQKESVSVASSSKNSVAKASHHKLSLSCEHTQTWQRLDQKGGPLIGAHVYIRIKLLCVKFMQCLSPPVPRSANWVLLFWNQTIYFLLLLNNQGNLLLWSCCINSTLIHCDKTAISWQCGLFQQNVVAFAPKGWRFPLFCNSKMAYLSLSHKMTLRELHLNRRLRWQTPLSIKRDPQQAGGGAMWKDRNKYRPAAAVN